MKRVTCPDILAWVWDQRWSFFLFSVFVLSWTPCSALGQRGVRKGMFSVPLLTQYSEMPVRWVVGDKLKQLQTKRKNIGRDQMTEEELVFLAILEKLVRKNRVIQTGVGLQEKAGRYFKYAEWDTLVFDIWLGFPMNIPGVGKIVPKHKLYSTETKIVARYYQEGKKCVDLAHTKFTLVLSYRSPKDGKHKQLKITSPERYALPCPMSVRGKQSVFIYIPRSGKVRGKTESQ